MRLITTFPSSSSLSPLVYSSILASEKIDHLLENSIIDGEKITEVWVQDEDQLEKAQNLLEEYRKNPKEKKIFERPAATLPPPRQPSLRPKGVFTISVLLACILLFIWSIFSRPKKEISIQDLYPSPALSVVEKKLLYDYPLFFQEKDELLYLLTKNPTQATNKVAEALHAKLVAMPVWLGIAQQILQHKKESTPLLYEGPIFEKISQGEIWRLVTPVFLHLDFLHIFFNLLWFLILAPQIEERIGLLRTSLLFLAGAILPNSAQYLISGSFFMGLSGVICAMAAFIWARQKIAPWEGYLLQRISVVVLAIFVGGLFLLSSALFWLQFFSIISFSLPIANTAHLVGGIVGYLLGRSRFFVSRI